MHATNKAGRWAAVIGIGAFLVFTMCFIAILFVNPPFQWTGLLDFAQYTQDNPQAFKYAGMFSMLVYGLAYVVLSLCARRNLPRDRRLYGDIAAAFALAFCVCIGVNYFMQLTATRLQLLQGYTEGLTQFTQSFPISALSALNMLGWTVFYGLSTAFLYLAYKGSAEYTALRRWCLLNSVFMLLSAIGYGFQWTLLLAVCMNAGLGAAGLGMLLCFARRFRRRTMDE
jgi:hypothetical protein